MMSRNNPFPASWRERGYFIRVQKLSRLYTRDNYAYVVDSAAMEGGFDQGGAGLRDIWKAAFQDFFDLVVAHHLPQAIGTEQEIIACLNRFGEPVHLHRILLSQATIDLITVRMGVDFFG